MKTLVSLLFALSIPFIAFTQCDNILSPTSKIVNNNRVQCILGDLGQVNSALNFNNELSIPEAGIDIEYGFTNSLWVAGVDPVGNLRVFTPEFDARDIVPGPWIEQDVEGRDMFCEFYTRHWVVGIQQIELIKTLFANGNLSVAQIPIDVLEWPGTDNPFISPFADDRNLAPFYDHNSDGVYNPMQGDLPIALEENNQYFPYEFSYSLFNDNNEATSGFTEAVGVEIHQISYVNQCGDDLVDNTIFHRLKVNYKSPIPLMDARIAYWEDPDIGCPQGDYVGCVPELNCSFSYNSFGVDAENCSFAFPDSINLIRSTIFPGNQLESFMYFLNAGTGNPNPGMIGPEQAPEYYNVMKGLWRDGTPLTESGSGYDLASSNITDHAFPFLPINDTDWTMQNVDLAALDMRKLNTIFSGDLQPGMSMTFDIIDLMHYGINESLEEVFSDFESNVNTILTELEAIKSGTNSCDNVDICQEDCVWPGDYNLDGICDGIDLLQWGYVSSVISPTGAQREEDNFEWYPHFAEDWVDEYDGVNVKHYDGDGSGQVNFADLFPVEANAFKVNTIYDGTEPEYQSSDFEFTVDFTADTYTWDPNGINEPLIFEASLTENGEGITTPIRGFTFQINIDDELFTNEVAPSQASNAFNLKRSLSNNNESKIAWVHQKFNDDTYTGEPVFISTGLFFSDNPVTTNEDGSVLFEMNISHAVALLEDGTVVELNVSSDAVLIENLEIVSSNNNDADLISNIQIYPNPVNDLLTIVLDENKSSKLTVFNMSGQLVNELIFNEKEYQIDISGLTDGLYYILINQDGKRYFKKIFKQ